MPSKHPVISAIRTSCAPNSFRNTTVSLSHKFRNLRARFETFYTTNLRRRRSVATPPITCTPQVSSTAHYSHVQCTKVLYMANLFWSVRSFMAWCFDTYTITGELCGTRQRLPYPGDYHTKYDEFQLIAIIGADLASGVLRIDGDEGGRVAKEIRLVLARAMSKFMY